MTSLRQLRAADLHSYLLALPDGAVLPRMKDIGITLNFGRSAGTYHVCRAFETLQAGKHLEQAHGTLSTARGHRVVRLKDGRLLHTADCPLVLP
jgi:hypothetical protein